MIDRALPSAATSMPGELCHALEQAVQLVAHDACGACASMQPRAALCCMVCSCRGP